MAQELVDHWFIPYGIPETLLTDNGPQFDANILAAALVIMGVKKLTTTEYHPQTNGQT